MTSSSISKRPHVHAEVIKAWAEGAVVEIFEDGAWRTTIDPNWWPEFLYRVRPEKVYPATRMSDAELCLAVPTMRKNIPPPSACEQFILDGFRNLANAALRHAIDAGQVVPVADYEALQRSMIETQSSLVAARDAAFREGLRNSGRDMAIAEAVKRSCNGITNGSYLAICNMDLAAIIKGIPC